MIRLVVATLLALAMFACRQEEPAESGRAAPKQSARPAASESGTKTGAKLTVFGIDGADWTIIDPLIERGRLPAFQRVKAVGSCAALETRGQTLSPIIWTTIATGRSPQDHGVEAMVVQYAKGGVGPVSSAHRKVAALWNVFSASEPPYFMPVEPQAQDRVTEDAEIGRLRALGYIE